MEVVKTTCKKAAGWVDDHLSDIAVVGSYVGIAALAAAGVALTMASAGAVLPVVCTLVPSLSTVIPMAAIAKGLAVTSAIGFTVSGASGVTSIVTGLKGKSLDGRSLEADESISRVVSGVTTVVTSYAGIQNAGRVYTVASGIEEYKDYNYPRCTNSRKMRKQLEPNALKNSNKEIVDPNERNKVLDPNKTDVGHKTSMEFRKARIWAKSQGVSIEDWKDWCNNPDVFQFEDQHNNRTHEFEDPTSYFDAQYFPDKYKIDEVYALMDVFY